MTMTIWEVAHRHPDRPYTITELYDRWRATDAGYQVYRAAVRRAYTLHYRGFTHYGIGAICEAIRYDRAVRVKRDEEGYRLNNNHRALLAREIMARHPPLRGFFELRRRTAP